MSEAAAELAEGIKAGDRTALARAITLTESTRPDHRRRADALLDRLMPDTGGAVRVGVSGAPGVGKSTFIDVIGLHLVQELGHRVAVLAVDPSSLASGGSILGDKTRMVELARHERAFVRPSPAGGTLGGVTRRTREAMLVCEAFGFDVVVVETVGVGQSESAVGDMVDCFLLLVQPGAGDELQGLKRGIVEMADVVVVTKADGEFASAASRAVADYRHAVRFLRPKHVGWTPPVLSVSAFAHTGVAETWRAVTDHQEALRATGEIGRGRARQAMAWLWQEVRESLVHDFTTDPGVAERLRVVENEVTAGIRSPTSAAAVLLRDYRELRSPS